MRQSPKAPTVCGCMEPRPVQANDEGSLAPPTMRLGSMGVVGADTLDNLPIIIELVTDDRAGTQTGYWFKFLNGQLCDPRRD